MWEMTRNIKSTSVNGSYLHVPTICLIVPVMHDSWTWSCIQCGSNIKVMYTQSAHLKQSNKDLPHTFDQ